MKKLFLTSFVALCLMMGSAASVNAQKYFTYDGDTFNVLLTTDNSNTNVTRVDFSANGKWVNFKILGFTSLDDDGGEGGFVYTVVDGQNKKFTVDYYRTSDKIIVRSGDGTSEWTLNRRK
jgi:hypothetical protein